MTVSEIKEAALYQSQNDIEDINDFRPVLAEYLDEAYDRLVFAYAGVHPGSGTTAEENMRHCRPHLPCIPVIPPSPCRCEKPEEPEEDPDEIEEEQEEPEEEWPLLRAPGDEPKTPLWTHMKLADWVTWRILSIGSPAKQQQGMVFRQSFEMALLEVKQDGPAGKIKHFINIPR